MNVPTTKPIALTSISVVDWTNPNNPAAPAGTYFSFEEADWEALFGPLCQYDPCQSQGLTCGEHGTCVAVSETEAKCSCNQGYSGEACDTTCDGYCLGSWPYDCNPNLPGKVKFGCLPGGGCNYLLEGEEYPYSGFCTFKEVVIEYDCSASGSVVKISQWRGGMIIWSGDVRVYPATAELSAYGHKEFLLGGAFQDGDQIMTWTSSSPTTSPLPVPTPPPSKLPTNLVSDVVLLMK